MGGGNLSQLKANMSARERASSVDRVKMGKEGRPLRKGIKKRGESLRNWAA